MKKTTFLFFNLLLPFLLFSQVSLNTVSPNSAHPMKILDVTITGNNTHFSTTNGTVVKFGFDQGTGTAVINKTTIVNQSTIITNITVPYVTYGAYDVSVNNSADGLITLPDAFTVTPQPTPSLVSVSPAAANTGQTLTLKLTGHHTNFTSGQGLQVSIDLVGPAIPYYTIDATAIHPITDTTLEADIQIPQNVFTGDYRIRVYNSTDGQISIAKGFHVNGLPAPALTSINPSSGRAGQTLNVTITGNNTHFKQVSKPRVVFGFNQATGTANVNSVSVTDDHTLQTNVTIPPDQLDGDYHVYVEDSIDNALVLINGFQVSGSPVASLLSASPSSVSVNQTLNVTLTGVNTHFQQAGNNVVDFIFHQGSGTLVVNSVTPLSETALKVNVTIPANGLIGNYDVMTSNSIDSLLFLPQGFNVHGIAPPALVSITPPYANAGQTLDVTITGTSTHFGTNNNTLTFNFKSATSTIVINSLNSTSDSTLKANITIPANSISGYYHPYLHNATDGYLSLLDKFYVNGVEPASILSVYPAEAKAGQTLNVTISGRKTHFTVNGTSVSFDFNQASGTTVVNSINVINDTLLNANITVPLNVSSTKCLISVFNTVDQQLLYYNFKVAADCHAFYKTSYNSNTNIFTLALDSATSYATSFHWDFGDGTTSSDKLPQHTFTSDTLYNVCLKIKTAVGDSCSYCHVIGKDSLGNPVVKIKGFSTKVVPFVPIYTTGTEEVYTSNSTYLYPNPVTHILNVFTSNIENAPVVSIYSVDARLLLQQALIKENTEIDVSRFSDGIYILEIQSSNGIKRLKFMKH